MKRWLISAVMVPFMLMATPSAVGAAQSHFPRGRLQKSSPAPVLVYGGDFPDPFVLVAGGTYYAYSTQVGSTNVPVMSSTSLTSWTAIKDALPTLPGWAASGRTWAPTVGVHSGTYVLYSTVEQASTGRQCITRATASSPTGPFTDSSTGPLVCQLTLGGSIDAYAFTDAGGTPYLLWKSDNNALGKPTTLWGQQLSADGLSFASGSSAVALVNESTTSPWQPPAIEGPAMVASGGTYYLFYGGGAWASSKSAIGYATCSSPLGPCRDQTVLSPWYATAKNGSPPVGPQGPTVFTDLSGQLRLGLSGWNGTVGYGNGGVRSFWIGALGFSRGKPVLT